MSPSNIAQVAQPLHLDAPLPSGADESRPKVGITSTSQLPVLAWHHWRPGSRTDLQLNTKTWWYTIGLWIHLIHLPLHGRKHQRVLWCWDDPWLQPETQSHFWWRFLPLSHHFCSASWWPPGEWLAYPRIGPSLSAEEAASWIGPNRPCRSHRSQELVRSWNSICAYPSAGLHDYQIETTAGGSHLTWPNKMAEIWSEQWITHEYRPCNLKMVQQSLTIIIWKSEIV